MLISEQAYKTRDSALADANDSGELENNECGGAKPSDEQQP